MSRVAIVRCGNYERQRVYEAVKRSIDLLGGISEFVKPDMKVLLKPNLLSPRPPEDGVDTHPEVVRAVVRLVKEAGGLPQIGDSPGGFGNNINEIYNVSGMKQVAEEEGAHLVKFTSSKFIDGIPISRHVLSADCFISIPKFKTHCVTVLTAAIKNSYGTVVGLHKTECHLKAPREEEFAKVIAKVYSAAMPALTILDGIVAMEGDGPSTGDLRNMNLIMASCDGVAMDSCLARIMGLQPFDVLVTKEASALGLGESDASRIEVVGDGIDTFLMKDFKLAPTTPLRLIPRPIVNLLAKFVKFKPYIDEMVCTRCNLCKISCPVSAIEIDEDICKIDYRICVRCLCCHEVCPYKAIGVRRNLLTKMIVR